MSNMDTINEEQDFLPRPNCIAFEANGNLIKSVIKDQQLLRKTQKIALNLFTSVSCKITGILTSFKTASEQKPEHLTWQCNNWWPQKPRTVTDCWAVLNLAESQSSKEKEKEAEETFGCWKQRFCFTSIFCSFHYFLFGSWITHSDKPLNSGKTLKKTPGEEQNLLIQRLLPQEMPLTLIISPCCSSVTYSFIISDLHNWNTNVQEVVMEHTVIRSADNIKLRGTVSMLKDRATSLGTATGWRTGTTQTSGNSTITNGKEKTLNDIGWGKPAEGVALWKRA